MLMLPLISQRGQKRRMKGRDTKKVRHIKNPMERELVFHEFQKSERLLVTSPSRHSVSQQQSGNEAVLTVLFSCDVCFLLGFRYKFAVRLLCFIIQGRKYIHEAEWKDGNRFLEKNTGFRYFYILLSGFLKKYDQQTKL